MIETETTPPSQWQQWRDAPRPQKEPREGLLGGGVSFSATGVGGQRGMCRHSHMQESMLGQGKGTGGRGGQGSEQTVWQRQLASCGQLSRGQAQPCHGPAR